MHSITIHNLKEEIYNTIKEKAKKDGLSLNKTIKNLLKKELGFSNSKRTDNSADFTDLFGVWSKKEAKEFEEATKDLEMIFEEDWK